MRRKWKRAVSVLSTLTFRRNARRNCTTALVVAACLLCTAITEAQSVSADKAMAWFSLHTLTNVNSMQFSFCHQQLRLARSLPDSNNLDSVAQCLSDAKSKRVKESDRILTEYQLDAQESKRVRDYFAWVEAAYETLRKAVGRAGATPEELRQLEADMDSRGELLMESLPNR